MGDVEESRRRRAAHPADLYRVNNPSFDDKLANWTPDAGDVTWSWDARTGHWKLGTAKCAVDGYDNGLNSSHLTVHEGDSVIFKVWVKWKDLVATGSPITLGGVG